MVAKKTAAKKTPAKTTAATKGTDKKLNTLEKKIGKVPKFFRELTTKDPEMFNLVMRFEQHIWDDGKLSRKTKKLIAIAIAAALRDQHAVRAQTCRCKKSWGHQSRGRRGAPRYLPPVRHARLRLWKSTAR